MVLTCAMLLPDLCVQDVGTLRYLPTRLLCCALYCLRAYNSSCPVLTYPPAFAPDMLPRTSTAISLRACYPMPRTEEFFSGYNCTRTSEEMRSP
eukprot:306306-Rhodomonas_salina.5